MISVHTVKVADENYDIKLFLKVLLHSVLTVHIFQFPDDFILLLIFFYSQLSHILFVTIFYTLFFHQKKEKVAILYRLNCNENLLQTVCRLHLGFPYCSV